jgi:type IV pilus assembly protein PilA
MEDAMKQNKGFTLIELMAVVSIISILAVIALAAYSDYVVRSKVSEGMVFVSEAKTSVSEFYYSGSKTLPQNNSEAGLPAADSYDDFEYMYRLEVSSVVPYGTIIVTFKIPGSKADGKVLELTPATIEGVVTWTCLPAAVNGMEVNHVPPNCRG